MPGKRRDFVIELLSGNINDLNQNFMDAMKAVVTDDFEIKYQVRWLLIARFGSLGPSRL